MTPTLSKTLLQPLGLVLALSLAVLGGIAEGGCSSEEPSETADNGCTGCHASIEHIHGPIEKDSCISCHGGDGAAKTQQLAHVPVPDDWAEIRGEALPPAPEGFIKDFTAGQLDLLDKDYLRFINPADLRVLDESCGPCHEQEAATLPTSVMATNSGHYFPSLYLSGTQEDRQAIYGASDISVENCEGPETACELRPLQAPTLEELEAAITSGDPQELENAAYAHYLSTSCNTCHQSSYPKNDSPALYRSTGCAACHVLYEEDGRYRGDDEQISKTSAVHPARHEITKAIPTSQCATCHFQGGRIGLLFQGIREGGFAELPEFAKTIDRPLFGHPPGFYVEDEDTRNDIDETPPGVHFQLGMHCADCHVGTDVHGDGKLHSSSKTQLDLQCEDCHGTVREVARPDNNGRFLTARGRHLPQLHLNADQQIVLTGVVDGKEHLVPQPADMLSDIDSDHPMAQAMAPDAHDWSHADSLTCDTCHTSYNQQCVGCHVTYDLRFNGIDRQTGLETTGVAISKRGATSLEQVLLGQRSDGRIQSVIASQQVQLTVVGSETLGGDGALLLGEDAETDGWPHGKFRSRDGVPHPGFAPFFQHTTTSTPRSCDSCHRRDDSPEELSRVRGVYGHGTGEFSLPGENGSALDPFQFLDANGTQLSEWQQPGTGAVDGERRERALNVILNGP